MIAFSSLACLTMDKRTAGVPAGDSSLAEDAGRPESAGSLKVFAAQLKLSEPIQCIGSAATFDRVIGQRRLRLFLMLAPTPNPA
jgi:hypothetical protein